MITSLGLLATETAVTTKPRPNVVTKRTKINKKEKYQRPSRNCAMAPALTGKNVRMMLNNIQGRNAKKKRKAAVARTPSTN